MSNDTWTPRKIISVVAATAGSIGILLWGVPYYIGTTVRAQVTAELAALPPDPHPVAATDFATNTEKIANIEKVVLRMEQQMILRDAVIMDYFKDKATKADDE